MRYVNVALDSTALISRFMGTRLSLSQHGSEAEFYESVKADPSWTVIENTTSGHVITLDESEWLADVLMKAA